ncbi:MAG: sigma-70 family RNA polymerase sigma factor [Calditrichaeota bacterium]|nr:sigma-70 family RNA polymerase sigma factor [Calditrichota bacterium]
MFRKNDDRQSDEALMVLLQSGDAGAFDALYHRYSQRLLVYFLRMLGNDRDKADDFLQDLFLKVIDKGGQFRAEARFSTWIFTVAHNMCKNEYRRREVRKVIDPEADVEAVSVLDAGANPGIHEALDRQRFQSRLQQVLLTCDDSQRSAFILRFQEHLSIREISEIMDCSEGTTKSRLFYVTKKLGKALGEFNPQVNGVLHHAGK